MTTQPAGEHHAGTLNLAGEGNAPQLVSDDLVRLASFTIAEYRTPDWDNLPEGLQAVEAASYTIAMRAALEAAYPAIRQQVAEEIAAKGNARPAPTTRLEDCGVHHAYPELHHCSECERAYCGRAGIADLAEPERT